MNVISIVGTRPQFIKLAALDSFITKTKPFNHRIIHSGQHYDASMSDVFFDQLGVTKPEFCISRDHTSPVKSMSNMMCQIEDIILNTDVDVILVYGDCDTTLAGALVANKHNIKLAHIESGLRSYNKQMPEEHNRVLTDHMSNMLFCSDKKSQLTLQKENIVDNTHVVGNLQIELLNNYLRNNDISERKNKAFMTIHRNYNTNTAFLAQLFDGVSLLDYDFIFPVHPRAMRYIQTLNIPDNVSICEPLDYYTTIRNIIESCLIVTDSGGIQLESWFLNKKCVVMRTESEWSEPLAAGCSLLYDRVTPLHDVVEKFTRTTVEPSYNLPINTSKLICDFIVDNS